MSDVIREIETDKAPDAAGPYSQGIAYGNLVFTAGEIPVDPADGKIPEGIEEQAELALRNTEAVLNAAGKCRALQVTVYLTDIGDFGTVNRIYAEHFGKPFPARSCIQAAALPKGVKIMVSAIGALEE